MHSLQAANTGLRSFVISKGRHQIRKVGLDLIMSTSLGPTCKSRRANTMDLMVACNWLSIKELGLFHSMITTWKLSRWKNPRNLAAKVSIDDNSMMSTTIPRLQNTQQSYRWRCVTTWNSLPSEIRTCLSLPRFKRTLRKWIIY